MLFGGGGDHLIFDVIGCAARLIIGNLNFSLKSFVVMLICLKNVLVTWCRPILNYFKFAPPPFERISLEGKNSELCGKVCELNLE